MIAGLALLTASHRLHALGFRGRHQTALVSAKERCGGDDELFCQARMEREGSVCARVWGGSGW